MTSNAGPYLMTADWLRELKQREVTTSRSQGWSMAPWIPISAEMAADILGKPVEEIYAVFGDTIEYRRTLTTVELRPGPPSKAEMRGRVSRILAAAGVG